jgi:hypothetical protein
MPAEQSAKAGKSGGRTCAEPAPRIWARGFAARRRSKAMLVTPLSRHRVDNVTPIGSRAGARRGARRRR